MEVRSMKRVLLILLPILVAFSLTGLVVLLTRVGPLPAKLHALELRKTIKSAVADQLEAIAEELPA
jgi:hypothetical protein